MEASLGYPQQGQELETEPHAAAVLKLVNGSLS